MKTWIFLQLAALAAVSVAQQDCRHGACYPQPGELLTGREQNLRASSTCGLTTTEIYCTPFGQWKMKCCPCDSRNPAGPNAHTVQNILPGARSDRWWQSKKDVSPVTLELDLQQLFQLDNMMLSFKGPRPDALIIERTKDFGKTWQPALYMATDCSSAFPWVTTATPGNLDKTYCYTLPPTSPNPYQDQRVYFHPLHQYSSINQPLPQKIEEVSGFTGLRVNLIKFGDVSRLPGRSPSQYYALKEITVTGSCFCHGHANRCLPDPNSNYLPTVQVNGVCECQHNTAGVNCERCADFYNDLPWRPAEQYNTHTCKRCECNNHSERCHFDYEVYERSGRRSGGVCDECLHNTAGQQCEHCAPNYYRNPYSHTQRPDTCLPCQCNTAGSVRDGRCDPATGVCVCKENVDGSRCERCKAGFYGLSAANTLGCSRCSCSVTGSLHNVCDAVTGQCVCRPNMEGVSCDRCAAGFWSSASGCQPCSCDPNNSFSLTCDQQTGQCRCRPGFMGRTCSGCPDNTYGDPLTGCRPCQCDSLGTVHGGCDKQTGVCRCKPGVMGVRCDACSRGQCTIFPQCPVCPSCFFSLDNQLHNLTLNLDRLAGQLDTQTGTVIPSNLAEKIQKLENTLMQIKGILSLPLPSKPLFNKDLDTLDTLRSIITGLNSRLPVPGSTPDLQGELNTLLAQLKKINLQYEVKKNTTPHTDNYTDALSAIKNAYDRSVEAEKQANATGETIEGSAALRGDTEKRLDSVQPANTKNLHTLGEDLATRPDLTPTAGQVCGSNRVTPCTPVRCEGELCPVAGAPTCGQGKVCTGALPQAFRAAEDSEEVQKKLQQLKNNITNTYTQIQQTQLSADQVRLATDELTNQIRRTRNDLEDDLKDVKEFITKLKSYLTDPSSDPAEVQRVCEAVLGVKLPEGAETLRKKLQEMQELAAALPDNSRLLKEAEPKLEQARRLLQDAQTTRNESLLLQKEADGLLAALNQSEDDIANIEKKLKQSLDLVNEVKDDIQKVDEVLSPADQLLKVVPVLLGSMRPLLEGLKDDVQRAGEEAQDAEKQAGGAILEANVAATELADLQKQLEMLKQSSNASSEASETEQLLETLKKNATALVQETVDMVQELTDKERSLQDGVGELLNKSELLAGLESELQKLVTSINSSATNLAMCQG